MSEYRNRLQEMMLGVGRRSWLKPAAPRRGGNGYAVCEVAACVAFLAGWLVAVISHV